MTNFVKDKWYKLKDAKPFYMKFSHWGDFNKDIRCSVYIVNGHPNFNYENHSISNSNWFVAKEVTIEEVRQYLPKDYKFNEEIEYEIY